MKQGSSQYACTSHKYSILPVFPWQTEQ